MSEVPIYIGVMHVLVIIPNARSLKDKRQAVRSLTERIKSRFEASCNLVGEGEHPGRQRLVLTTGGKDAHHIRRVFDNIRTFIDGYGRAWPGSVDVELFSWHPGFGPVESQYG